MQGMATFEAEIIGLIQILKGLGYHAKELRFDLIGSWSY